MHPPSRWHGLWSGGRAGMIGLASWQIIGRNLFSSTYILGDELLRLMVLWLTLAGAMAASRADRHISISLLDRFLEGRKLALARVTTHAFTAAICGMLGSAVSTDEPCHPFCRHCGGLLYTPCCFLLISR